METAAADRCRGGMTIDITDDNDIRSVGNPSGAASGFGFTIGSRLKWRWSHNDYITNEWCAYRPDYRLDRNINVIIILSSATQPSSSSYPSVYNSAAPDLIYPIRRLSQ